MKSLLVMTDALKLALTIQRKDKSVGKPKGLKICMNPINKEVSGIIS
jgi:hypothetical protein